ncbi:MAG: hypothetical protein M0Z82_17130, partial [Actinomycetota bacterium]|nr:hypothetical protein [Actinomycetota bacterium]
RGTTPTKTRPRTTSSTAIANLEAHDANVIVANNGDVVTAVGAGGTVGKAPTGGTLSPLGFLTFNYDLYGNPGATEWIVPRAVTRLDYTPGGPDLAHQAGPLVTGSAATNGVGDIGGHPETVTGVTLQKGSEIHATSGAAFIYGGPADTVIYGGGQNDTILLGYGDNWVSGGRGDQCIVASGLCLASRNSTTYGEPLYGISKLAAVTQLIATPGNVQTAMINVTGSLKYTAYMWPYSVNPTTSFTNPTWADGCKTNAACPPYWDRYGHNIIYGGWGSDSIHGGPGDSAISGAEAPTYAFTDNFSNTCTFTATAKTGESCTTTDVHQLNTAAIRSDWYHPFNPGNVLGWTTPTTHHGPNPPDGKFKMFTGTDPRRKVMLTSTGALCKWGTGYTAPTRTKAGCLPWIMDYTPADLAAEPVNATWANGTYGPTPWSGTDVIFGDLGNDWIMGGQGRTQVFGGFGNDLIDLRATLTVDGGLNDGPVPNPITGTYGTPGWEGLAYGGAGQDIFFAGTAGDRLIDWVGNHNTYYVPFSNFGMPTVSRTLQPSLPQFLYALSKSDGADPLLGLRYGGAPTRNGEPFGELGLVLQHDAAWHTMMGPPFDKMPENLAGVGTDVPKTANTLPIGSSGVDTVPASASAGVVAFVTGMGAGLPSGTDATGAGAVVKTLQVTDTTRRPGSPTVALTPASDSGPFNTDYITNVTTPSFLVTPGATAVTTTVYVNGVPYTGQVLPTGTYTVSAVSLNVAGNPSYTAYAPKTLVIDTNPPTGSFSVKGTTIGGVTYTDNPALSLSLAFSAAPAGLSQMAFSTDGGATFGRALAYATSAVVSLPDATGTYTVAVAVTDLAGNTAVFTAVVDLVRSAATISSTLSAPTNAGSYDVGQQITLTAGATAADPVVSVTATLDGKAWSLGTALDTATLAAGNHTLVITATDAAGNVTTETLTLAVHATVAGLVAGVDYGVAQGSIRSSTAATALETALAKAQSAVSAHETAAASTDLEQFVGDLTKYKKVITPSYASLLAGWADDLITRL